jgi:hypothetical protein
MTTLVDDPCTYSMSFGYWSAPFHDVPPCGDAAACQQRGSCQWLLVIDAIGHGPVAARIAQRIIGLFDEVLAFSSSVSLTPAELLRRLHHTLFERHQDEQAALGLFCFDLSSAELNIAMVGNLDAILLNHPNSIRIHSQNGMVGGRMPSHIRESHYPLADNTVLAVFSDGMRFNELSDVLAQHVYHTYSNRPLTIAARALVDRFRRQHDDSSCALVRICQLIDG